jgi:hypothetical protein
MELPFYSYARLTSPQCEELIMADTLHPLVLDLVEWVAREPRPYSEVLEGWRTSCPRLAVWEEVVDRGYVAREAVSGRRAVVSVTDLGRSFLHQNGRGG